jgi:hypothetical protein
VYVQSEYSLLIGFKKVNDMHKITFKTFLTLTLMYLAVVTSLYADENDKPEKVKIKYIQDSDVKVFTELGDVKEIIVLKKEDLNDLSVLQDKLANLHQDTREIVMSALEKAGEHIDDVHENVKVIVDDQEGQLIKMLKYAQHIEDTVGDIDVIKHKIVYALDDDETSIQGHTNAIVKLIEHGEFSQDELDQIQLAIDKKR